MFEFIIIFTHVLSHPPTIMCILCHMDMANPPQGHFMWDKYGKVNASSSRQNHACILHEKYICLKISIASTEHVKMVL